MLNITVNKDKIFQYKEENGKKLLNGEEVAMEIESLEAGNYSVLYRGKSYLVEVLDYSNPKLLKIKINGKVAEVSVQDKNDLLLEKMGMSSSLVSKVQEVKAPMPGLVLEIKIKEGDLVKVGDTLLVLEAMKMENVLKSPCDGIVQQILIKKGDTVEKNKLLIKFQS